MTQTVVSNRFQRRDADEHRCEIVSPEGVPIVFRIGRFGDRAFALLIDGMWILLGVLALLVSGFILPWDIVGPLVVLAFFLLRNGYFMWHEVRSGGRTPGKRRVGLRVVDASGGALRTESLVVRNLTREIEWFLPIGVLSSPEVMIESGPAWLRIVAVLWVVAFLLMPLLNRERRRVGDLLAGTMVVVEPRARLQSELAQDKERVEAGIRFTPEQLEKYGVYELQVLEEILRNRQKNPKTYDLVAAKIRNKIGWVGRMTDARTFLHAFYDAQRARLEHDLLLGRARERKDS